MRYFVLLAAVGLVGCGPAWDGRFTGTLTDSTACADGSGGSSSGSVDWTATEKSSGLEVLTDGPCHTVLADVSGTTATIRPKLCDPIVVSGTTFQQTLNGTGTLAGDSLAVDVRISTRAIGATQDACNTRETGVLTRRK